MTGGLVGVGLVAAARVLAGCQGGEGEAALPVYPMDDVLRVNHAQSVGTHNSYHLDTLDGAVPPWDYSHAPLDVQLGEQGVRQFELDTYWRRTAAHAGRFEVLHVPVVDQGVTCGTVRACLTVQRAWSDDHPGHLPFLTLIETKSSPDSEVEADRMIAELQEEVAAVWSSDRLVVPAQLNDGWPLLSVARGRGIYVLHAGGRARDALLRLPLEQMLLVPDDAPAAPGYAQFHSSNDPTGGGADAIAGRVRAGHLVRTRADVDGEQARAMDASRLDAALASGAHYISTDFPVPHPDTGYVVRMPGGTPGRTPSRCNPLTSPPGCTPQALEITD